MSRHNTIGKVATKVTQNSDTTVVRYHNTNVVTITPTRIILNHGGYTTMTTKVRMNQAAQQYSLGYSVFQKDRCFYVRINEKCYPFLYDSLTIDRNTGQVYGPCDQSVSPVIVK